MRSRNTFNQCHPWSSKSMWSRIVELQRIVLWEYLCNHFTIRVIAVWGEAKSV